MLKKLFERWWTTRNWGITFGHSESRREKSDKRSRVSTRKRKNNKKSRGDHNTKVYKTGTRVTKKEDELIKTKTLGEYIQK